MEFRNITNDMRTRVDQMVKARVFDDKSGSGHKAKSTATKFKKKGEVNAVVEEEDDGGEKEVKDEELSTREHLF